MSYITLTGADNSTTHDDLWRVADQYRFGLVEWGVLYSASNQGEGRYPSFDWIELLSDRLGNPSARTPAFALHVCGGKAVSDFLAGTGHVCEVARNFKRVQVNFRHESFALDQVERAIRRNLGKQVITQHNHVNAGLWKLLAGHRNHAVLFDASGGRGVAPEYWPTPLDGVGCGYAGGLGPDNLSGELPRIHGAASGKEYWIDMESKVRNASDQFDLDLAKRCLDIASEFHLQNVHRPLLAEVLSPFPDGMAENLKGAFNQV